MLIQDIQEIQKGEPKMYDATHPHTMSQIAAELRNAYAHTSESLGMPLSSAAYGIPAATQRMEYGLMLQVRARRGTPTREVTVIYGNDTYSQFYNIWQPGEPDTPYLSPPLGRYVPWRWFSAVWSVIPQVQDGLGWAIEPGAAPTRALVQRFAGGTLMQLADTGIIFAFYGFVNGRVEVVW
jgi:hypothetical protein